MSEAQARKLVQEAGGADKICREASLLLNVGKYKNPYEFHSLSIYDNPLEITNYPALSVLVTNSHTRSLVLEHGHDGLPPHIQIMYGPHMHIKFMSIFGETNGLDQHFVDSHVQLSSNIFFSK